MLERSEVAIITLSKRVNFFARPGVFFLLVLAACGCDARPVPRVVVYTSVDQVFAEALFARFQAETGIRVEAVFDSEAGKTTGLVQRLIREKQRPRADVWLSSEVFGTLHLADEGVLVPGADPPDDIPPAWTARDGTWRGFAARCRVLAFDPERVPPERRPRTWADCTPQRLGGPVAVANPQFGTTRGHVAALFAELGGAAATALLQELRDGDVLIADGNSQAVRLVESGQAVACWTDTDDVWVARRRGARLEVLYPKLAPDAGPLWIPCSAGLVAGGPHPDTARRLLDYLAGSEVERALAESDSRNVPLRADLRQAVGHDGPAPEAHDFAAIAAAVPEAMRAARDILLR